MLLLALSTACGGGGPAGPSSGPSPQPSSPVNVVVFHDDNGNGILDANEGSRIPDVEVRIGGGTARSSAGGRAVVPAPTGAQTITLNPATLPPFFAAGPPVPVQVPAVAEINLPVTLPTGNNTPRLFMAFGDSITTGEGSSDGVGYPGVLERKLTGFFGGARVESEARQGRITESGVRFIDDALNRRRPAYTLVLLGTNDWNLLDCQDRVPCVVVDNLRTIVRVAKSKQSLPVLGTIPPVNPAINADRNKWVSEMDGLLRTMAGQEGAVVADVYGQMSRVPNPASLYVDQIHPNDAGHELIAQAFFDAITKGRVGP